MKKYLLLLTMFVSVFSTEVFSQNDPGNLKFLIAENEATAAKVVSMEIDGFLDEPEWNIDYEVTNVVLGTPGEDLNEIHFGLAYNATYLFIGIDVFDSILTPFEMGEVFIDGNKNGGDYDEYDLHLRFAGPYYQVVYPDSIVGVLLEFNVKPLADGFTAELAIPWAELSITPHAAEQIGFDLILSDSDSGTGVDYMMAWNGNLANYQETTYFGDLVFRPENTVTATSVIMMTVDGVLDDAGWDITQPISNVISGEVGADSNVVYFGVAYNAEYLYVGVDGTDAALTLNEMGEVFIDGSNDDGEYGEHDMHLRFDGPLLSIVYPDTIMGVLFDFGVKPLADGYTAELGIPWSELGITPAEGANIGFDVLIGDGDLGTGVDYIMSWNGTLQNYENKALFGDLVFGVSSGVNDRVDFSNEVVLFPNPSTGHVSLEVISDALSGIVNVKVIDITGRTLIQDQFDLTNDNKIELDAGLFTRGTYFVTVQDGKGAKAMKKLIVE